MKYFWVIMSLFPFWAVLGFIWYTLSFFAVLKIIGTLVLLLLIGIVWNYTLDKAIAGWKK